MNRKYTHFLSVKLTNSNWMLCSFESVRRTKNENSYFRKNKTCRFLDIYIVIVALAHTWNVTTYGTVKRRFEVQENEYIITYEYYHYADILISCYFKIQRNVNILLYGVYSVFIQFIYISCLWLHLDDIHDLFIKYYDELTWLDFYFTECSFI